MAGRKRKKRSYSSSYRAGGDLGRGVGTIAGEALIPIPGIGGAVGGFVGEGLGEGFQQLLTSLFASAEDVGNFDPTQGQDVGTVRMQEGGPLDIDPREIARKVIASAEQERQRLLQLFNSGALDKERLGSLLNTISESVRFAKSRIGESDSGGENNSNGEARSVGDHFKSRLEEAPRMEGERNPVIPKFRKGGKSGIHIKKKNRGKFTAFAKKKGMGVQEAARHVLANKDKYSSTVVKRANFARNASKWNKKQFGGQVPLTGSAVAFNGPIHEDGGIPLPGTNIEVEGGETMGPVGGNQFVFSNAIKIPGSNETFADRHKRLVESGASKTAINKLASLQESVKKSKGTLPRNKKQFGGILDDDDPTQLGEITVEAESQFTRPKGLGPDPLGTPDIGSPTTLRNINFTPSISLPGVSNGRSIGDIARGVAPFAGDIINTTRGLFGRTTPEPATRVDRSHIEDFPTTVNVRPEIDAATRAYRSVVGAPGVSGSQRLAAHANQLQNLARIHGTRQRAETDLASRRAQLAGRASELDARFDEQRRQETGALRAARSSLLSEGLAGFARTLQGLKAEDLAHESNLIGLASIMTQLPENQREQYMKTVLENLPSNRRNAFKKMVGRK